MTTPTEAEKDDPEKEALVGELLALTEELKSLQDEQAKEMVKDLLALAKDVKSIWEQEIDPSAVAAFGLESDLQLALRRSINQLEPGLTIIDGDREQIVASGCLMLLGEECFALLPLPICPRAPLECRAR